MLTILPLTVRMPLDSTLPKAPFNSNCVFPLIETSAPFHLYVTCRGHIQITDRFKLNITLLSTVIFLLVSSKGDAGLGS